MFKALNSIFIQASNENIPENISINENNNHINVEHDEIIVKQLSLNSSKSSCDNESTNIDSKLDLYFESQLNNNDLEFELDEKGNLINERDYTELNLSDDEILSIENISKYELKENNKLINIESPLKINAVHYMKYYSNESQKYLNVKLFFDDYKKTIKINKIHNLLSMEMYLKTINYDDIVGIKKIIMNEDDDNYYLELSYMPLEKNTNKRLFNIVILDPKIDDTIVMLPVLFENHLNRPKRKIQMFINPHAGTGSANDYFYDEIYGALMSSSNMEVNYYVLSSKEDCKNMILQTDLSDVDYYGIMGGDGTITEIVNYLVMFNKLKPITIFPCGTYNAIYRSLNNDCKFITNSIYSILNGETTTHTLVDTKSLSNIIVSKLTVNSISWGFPSDIDYDTRNLRIFGKFRLSLGTFWRSIAMRKYLGKFTYLPLNHGLSNERYNEEMSKFSNRDIISFNTPWITLLSNNNELNNQFVGIWASTKKHTNDGLIIDDYDNDSDKEYFRIIIIKYGLRWIDFMDVLTDLQRGNIPENPFVAVVYAKAFILEPFNKVGGDNIMVDGEQINYSIIRAKYSDFNIQIR
jgi:diacylglycerol kinase family enzyme